jgi:putative FmdB family regulatory protein
VPTYEYRCDNCATNFDVVQSFHDDPLTECPTCGSPVRKVFGNVGIVFKGSGFYKTDSRSGGGPSKGTTEPSTVATESSAPSAPTSDAPTSGPASDKGSGPAPAADKKATPKATPAASGAGTSGSSGSGGSSGSSTSSD